jgi:hypothetical protein
LSFAEELLAGVRGLAIKSYKVFNSLQRGVNMT